MKQRMKRFLGILIGLTMVLGLMTGMCTTAFAWDGDPYAALVNKAEEKVTFNGIQWYVIEDGSTAVNAGTLTLFAAEDKFTGCTWDFNQSKGYNDSGAKQRLDEIVAGTAVLKGSPNFSGVADAMIASNGGKLWLLSVGEANAVPQDLRKFSAEYYLRDNGAAATKVAIVKTDGTVDATGVNKSMSKQLRPAMKLDLSKVVYAASTKTFKLGYTVEITGYKNATVSGGAVKQEKLKGAMETVTITANAGCHFDEFAAPVSASGVVATRVSETVVTVSGTPTDDVNLVIPDAVDPDQGVVAEVAEKINALPESDKITLENKEAVEAAKKAYDDLNDVQKAKVDANVVKKLNDAVTYLTFAQVLSEVKPFTGDKAIVADDQYHNLIETPKTQLPDSYRVFYKTIEGDETSKAAPDDEKGFSMGTPYGKEVGKYTVWFFIENITGQAKRVTEFKSVLCEIYKEKPAGNSGEGGEGGEGGGQGGEGDEGGKTPSGNEIDTPTVSGNDAYIEMGKAGYGSAVDTVSVNIVNKKPTITIAVSGNQAEPYATVVSGSKFIIAAEGAKDFASDQAMVKVNKKGQVKVNKKYEGRAKITFTQGEQKKTLIINCVMLKINASDPLSAKNLNVMSTAAEGKKISFSITAPFRASFDTSSKKFKNKDVLAGVSITLNDKGNWVVSGTVKKKGTVTIPFSVDGKTYKCKIKVKF